MNKKTISLLLIVVALWILPIVGIVQSFNQPTPTEVVEDDDDWDEDEEDDEDDCDDDYPEIEDNIDHD